MKAGTAPGYDHVYLEILKNLGPRAQTWLSHFFSRIIIANAIPKIWRKTKVIAIEKLETKASSHEGQCIRAGYCHAHTCMELITISIVTIRSIWHKLCDRFFFAFWKISAAICESCGATYRRNYETFSAL